MSEQILTLESPDSFNAGANTESDKVLHEKSQSGYENYKCMCMEGYVWAMYAYLSLV